MGINRLFMQYIYFYIQIQYYYIDFVGIYWQAMKFIVIDNVIFVVCIAKCCNPFVAFQLFIFCFHQWKKNLCLFQYHQISEQNENRNKK